MHPGENIQTISIFGATGSIGDSTISLLRLHKERFKVRVLTANSNYQKLYQLALEFEPEYIVIANDKFYEELKNLASNLPCKILSGDKSLEEAANVNVDIAVSAIVGIAGLRPSILLARFAKLLAIANKESLVCAGKFLLSEAKAHNTKIIPLDSEHNSLYRIFDFASPETVKQVVITASGGPFLNFKEEELQNVTPLQAVKHPSWNMGAKISVDCATLMNKALEVIETYRLFPVASEQISVIIHKESIFHAFVRYIDGSVKSLLSTPDMRIPISLALGFPKMLEVPADIDLLQLNNSHFEAVDLARHRAINLAYEAIKIDGSYPIVLNGSNEILVEKFLNNAIRFPDIINIVEQVLESFTHVNSESIEHVFSLDQEARSKTKEFLSKKSR